MKLTNKEKTAIAALEQLERQWPETLWLFCNGMKVYIMKKDAEGNHATLKEGGGMDPDYIVGTVDIDSDGGDW